MNLADKDSTKNKEKRSFTVACLCYESSQCLCVILSSLIMFLQLNKTKKQEH